ncbi:hypothetical protein [Methylomonas sp. AM2-LC]|uniref:hypothetical protein n=1 Tax=Methylomonas sp. AM2-LC TaxID=3153301 RepID=UPI003263451C
MSNVIFMESVMLGKCKLCKETKELKDSHVIPKLIYRYMRKHQDTTNNLNGLLTLDSKKKQIDVTQRQWQDKLFCEDCELLLSKNETKFARILHDINLMKKEELAKEYYSTDDAQLFEEFKRVAIFAKACLGASQPQQAAKTTRPFNASGGPDSPSSPALAPKRLKS